MATTMAEAMSLIEDLNGLVTLEFDAAAAYEAAIKRLGDPIARDQLAGFMSDHLRHIQELSAILRDMGQLPPLETDFKALLTQGKVVIGGLVGDSGIFAAMRSNEEDIHLAYERMLKRGDLRPTMQNVLTGGLADERRHRAWLDNRLSGR